MDNYELNPITGNLDIVGVSSEKLKQILATLTEPLVFAGTVIVLDNGGQEANTIAVHSVNNELTFTSDIIPDETLLSAVKCDPGWVWVVVTGGLSHELGQLNVGDNILIVSPSDFYGLHAEVLTDIVPIGYQFIGVADPTTNDNDIDVNVKCVWFAATAGTYTGLGNVVVDANELAVITRVASGGVASYAKVSLGKYVKTSDIVDDLETDDETKVLSAKQGKVLGEEIGRLDIKIGKTPIAPIIDKKYIALDAGVGEHIGAESNSPSWHYMTYPVEEGDTVIVNGTGANGPRLWAFIDDQEIILSVADPNASGVNLKLVAPANTAEVIINTMDVSVPSYYIKKDALQNQIGDITELTTTNKNNLVDAVNEVNNGITGIGENVTLLNEEVTNLANKVDNVVVATNLITWTDNRFVKSTAEIVTTSATNKVGSIDVAGRNIVNFNFSVKKGGSYSKLGWFVVSAAGSVLLNSSEYASTTNVGATDVEVKLPEGAKTLYISWNPDLSDFQYLKFKDSIQELYELVGNIEDRVNIENLEVRAFDAIRYNDADYSYTRCPYPDNISYKRNVEFSYPNAISINTPIDVNATTRHLEFANNKAFTNGRVISLDLVSPQYMLTNLEGDKIYYYRVYKDSTVTAVLSSGWFKTDGHIRDLLIKANSNFEYEYIMNVRDIGGWKTSSGKRLRYGCIIRGQELNHVEDNVTTSYISQDGIDELKALGVSAELDLRADDYMSESALGNDVAYESIAVDLFFYRLNIYNNPVRKLNQFKSCLQQIITWLSEGKGIYIHCAGGCDRTGFLIALIEGICGVSENDINHDYELSGRDRSREYYTIAGGGNYDGDFKFAIEYIKGLLEYNGNIYVYYRGNYYDPTATITSFTPVPISDPTLIEALNALPFGTFKQCWRRLMMIGGVDMSERDMDMLSQLLCS